MFIYFDLTFNKYNYFFNLKKLENEFFFYNLNNSNELSIILKKSAPLQKCCVLSNCRVCSMENPLLLYLR